MPGYVLLLRATEAGASRMLLSGASGAAAQRSAIERLGGTDVRQMTVTGNYDVVITCELPDEVTSLAVSIALEAGGFYTNVLRAFSSEDVDAARSRFPDLPAMDEGDREGEDADREA